jgi:hypothetical protein
VLPVLDSSGLSVASCVDVPGCSAGLPSELGAIRVSFGLDLGIKGTAGTAGIVVLDTCLVEFVGVMFVAAAAV